MRLPPILDLDATALAQATRSGELTCAEVTRAYLNRLQALNPWLRAVITVNPEAQAEAVALDQWPTDSRGPLHGVPMLLKDNIDVAGFPTTAGSWLMRDHIPGQDSPVAARLKAAGAVILGKANMTEWANFMTLGMTDGYSSMGGQTVNPWGAELDTGGSSSGSGVGVAARLCAAAIGTETSGSIVSPAHENGVIGLKPTIGLVPRTGIVPISHTQDTAGPITRSARDAALILSVMAGPDQRDPATHAVGAADMHLTGEGLQGLRFTFVQSKREVEEDDQQATEQVKTTVQKLGAEVAEQPFPESPQQPPAGEMLDVLLYEFKGDLNAYLAGVTDGPRTLKEVIQQNDAEAERCLRYGQALLHASEGTRGDYSERAYALARANDIERSRTQGFDLLFSGGSQVVIFPGIHGYGLAAKAGYPSLALPVYGKTPSGVLLVAPARHDFLLTQVAELILKDLGGVQFPPEQAT